MDKHKRRDGFEGQKLISLPEAVCLNHAKKNTALSQIYITHIGYFPKAIAHYRLRKNGCKDNILIYCLRGKGWYRIGSRTYQVGPNQFFIIPATTQYISYGADETDPWTIYWVHFSGPDMAGFNKSLNINTDDGPREIPLNEKGLQVWENMYESLEMGYSTDNLNNANFCLYHFIATFLYPDKHQQRKSPAAEDHITQTILYMRSRLHEKLTVEDMAATHNLSASYFSTLFRKATGMPPIDYFIHLKIQKACQLLFQNNLKVKDVAEAIGYDDPYHFSRLFKKHMNVSPEQYKAASRREE
ncbi:AraC-like ligand binding domain-containing protein [Chitinophaga rupis]|uniref:AraC-like ligand binding domain-containing protein n=1 Tax=Chitinophaga rupis TaxID=573321 RepID=A0A1H8EWT5_9BACT|nr:AraC family transcriptional regulator [Chitinophaga rupis]SEN23198.1 AraC-like ligand binding domain-containing protein [Chitinophaga rupis]